LIVVVVLPTPPFWLKIATTFAFPCSVIGGGVGIFAAFLPRRVAVVATSSCFVDLAFKRQTSFP
jgi:hypothetical protein